MSTSLWVSLMIAIALFAGVLLPYLIEEIKRGKMQLGPRTPVGAGDTHPGYRGNPTPGQSIVREPGDQAMLSLRSFHMVLISLSIVLAAGTGVWALRNSETLLGVLSLAVALLLIFYGTYFLGKADRMHLQ
jgi:hypothetical protein